MKRLSVLAVAVALLAAACSESDPIAATTEAVIVETTTAPGSAATTIATEPVATTPTVPLDPPEGFRFHGERIVPEVLDGFDFSPIWLPDDELFVAIAGTTELRRQGLMHLTDLGDLDGMLFVFEQDSSSGFWMKNTLIPLDIAFFDSAGSFVDGFVMEPCTTAACPSYLPSGDYRYALEMPAGQMPNNTAVLMLVEPE
jgi:uncharacterized membrane protein (UPF0127 family)